MRLSLAAPISLSAHALPKTCRGPPKRPPIPACMQTAGNFAIKCFLNTQLFRRERDLFAEPALRPLMPATIAVEDNAAGDCRTRYGYAFPPFVVTERGQSLAEWASDSANNDFMAVFEVRLSPRSRCSIPQCNKSRCDASFGCRIVAAGETRRAQHRYRMIQ